MIDHIAAMMVDHSPMEIGHGRWDDPWADVRWANGQPLL